jgi:hypothetical protein
MARGMPVVPAEPVVTAACYFFAGGPWVRPASGIPCALFLSRAMNLQNSGKSCRENAELRPLLVIARSVSDEAIHGSTSGDMDCFASLAMTKDSCLTIESDVSS